MTAESTERTEAHTRQRPMLHPQLQAPPLAALRGVGLELINSVGPLRNGIMQYAMLGEG